MHTKHACIYMTATGFLKHLEAALGCNLEADKTISFGWMDGL